MTYRLQNLMLAPFLVVLLALSTLFMGLGNISQNFMSGGYQLFEQVESGFFADKSLNALENFDRATETASECCNAPNRTLTSADFPDVNTRLSAQRQARHIEGGINPRTGQPITGGVMRSQGDAQQVLDAYRSGNTTVIGQTRRGFPIVRYDGVTGLNNSRGAGFVNQETNYSLSRGRVAQASFRRIRILGNDET